MKHIILILIFGQVIAAGQINPFKLNLQTNKDLIRFVSSSGSNYNYEHYIRQGDTVLKISACTTHADRFIDSLKKEGYSDKPPKYISKTSTWALQSISHEFLRVDTIYNKPDSIFVTRLSVLLQNTKHNINRHWTYSLYSNMNAGELNKKINDCDNHSLVYYSRCKIYVTDIDVDMFTMLIGTFERYQHGQYFKREYFK